MLKFINDYLQVWPFTFQQHQQNGTPTQNGTSESIATARPSESHVAWYERDTSVSNHYNVHFYSALSTASNSPFEDDRYHPKNTIPDPSSLNTEHG